MKQITITKSGDYTYTLDHEGDELEVKCGLWLKGNDQLNLNLKIIHAAPHTTARTSLKVVVDDEAKANLNGTIIVKKDAQVTNSFLEERVLLLSAKAKADAIPNLEIEANDVKCSHAAAIGRVNDEELFYLQSRGISEAEAKHLIAQGFLSV